MLGLLNDNPFYLYTLEQVEELNDAYNVKIYVPDWLLIGTDGGPDGIFLDCVKEVGAVYRVGLGVMDYEEATQLAASLSQWVERRFPLHRGRPNYPDVNYPDVVDVWLLRAPTDKARGLIRLKNELSLTTRIVDLYKGLDHLPYRLLRAAPFYAYVRKCAEYNKVELCLGLFEVDQPDRPIEIPDWAGERNT